MSHVVPNFAPRPEVMSGRAKVNLALTFVVQAALAVACIFIPDSFKSSSFVPLLLVAPLWAWGVVFGVFAVSAAIGIKRESVGWASFALGGSATTSLVWGATFLVAWYTGDLASPTGPIIWLGFSLKEYVACSQPLRSPMEPLIRRICRTDDEEGCNGGDG